MGFANVRNAVASWFDAPAVAGLSKVYASEPREDVTSNVSGGQLSSYGPSAVAFLVIPDLGEARIAFGGANGGEKQTDYAVELHLSFRASGNALSGDASVESAFDDLLDALLVRMRSDHTFGGALFEAGEKGVTISRGRLREYEQNLYEAGAIVTFVATEIINA